MSISALEELCEQNNLQIADLEYKLIHGGTIRATIKKGITQEDSRAFDFITNEEEGGYLDLNVYEKFAQRAIDMQTNLFANILRMKELGHKIVAFGNNSPDFILCNDLCLCGCPYDPTFSEISNLIL